MTRFDTTLLIALPMLAAAMAGCSPTPSVTVPTPSMESLARPTELQILTPAPTSTPRTTATAVYIPQPPPSVSPPVNSSMTDVLTTSLADERRATADSFSRGIFERPYTAEEMEYLAYLDIGRVVTLAVSGEWVYVSIPLAGAPPEESDAHYAVEIDVNTDGRGDWLILAPAPASTEWTQEGLLIFIDSNGDVGGATPGSPDTAQDDADGFDALVFNQGSGLDPDAAWLRRDPDDPSIIQFAFQYGLIAYDHRFLWRVIASGNEIDPGMVELNDHFTLEEAGSPLLTSPHYPIQAIAEIDTSCRWSYGFTPLGTEPGICGGAP